MIAARRARLRRTTLLAATALAAAGCGTGRVNPSLSIPLRDARAELERMSAAPKPLARPVLVLAGWGDPGLGPAVMTGRIRRVAADGAIVVPVAFFFSPTFDACRERVFAALERELGTAIDGPSPEVDVVAISMGGLVAREAARPRADDPRRLVIGRLLTIATPHRGANLAALPTLDARVRDMRAGSDFLARLDAAPAPADEIVPYARLDDVIVGAGNAAPPGTAPYWVETPPLELAHVNAASDPRIVVDILRRLRGEMPVTAPDRTPVPGRSPE